MALTKAQAAELDDVGDTIDRQLARAGERLQAARRIMERRQDEYDELAAARTKLRSIR